MRLFFQLIQLSLEASFVTWKHLAERYYNTLEMLFYSCLLVYSIFSIHIFINNDRQRERD